MEEAIGWIVAAGILYGGYKLIFGSSTGSGGSRSRVTSEMVERVRAVFPGVSERGVRWELERNGGSVERAVERALREGGLPEPPASYFPPSPQDPQTSGTATPHNRPTTNTTTGRVNGGQAQGAGSSGLPSKIPPPSLIKRMGLNGQLASSSEKGKEIENGGKEGWAGSREEREERLRRRKEKLVLEARRKLLDKERQKKESTLENED